MTTKTKLTIPDLIKRKRDKERVVMVAIADFLMAGWAERAGVDVIGVGDSLSMVTYGHETTLPVTLEQMIEHTKAVRRGAPNTFILACLPYGTYSTRDQAVENAQIMMKDCGADAIKIQGGRDMFDTIQAMSKAGLPVMSHVGLAPHFVHKFGGFKMQGRTAEDALKIIDDGRAVQEAGAYGFEIEAVPYEVGKAVDEAVDIFTFSIGAGAYGNCQLLNGADLVGAFDSFKPKFAKRYGNLSEVATNALKAYCEDVRSSKFPDADHSYKMKEEEVHKLKAILKQN